MEFQARQQAGEGLLASRGLGDEYGKNNPFYEGYSTPDRKGRSEQRCPWGSVGWGLEESSGEERWLGRTGVPGDTFSPTCQFRVAWALPDLIPAVP